MKNERTMMNLCKTSPMIETSFSSCLKTCQKNHPSPGSGVTPHGSDSVPLSGGNPEARDEILFLFFVLRAAKVRRK